MLSVPKYVNALPFNTVERHVEHSIKLNTALNIVNINDDILSWNSLCEGTHPASIKILEFPAYKRKDWFNVNNTDILRLIDEMQSCRKID